MYINIDYKNKGYNIQFQTRGVNIEEASKIWNDIDPKNIVMNTKEKDAGLYVRKDNLAFELIRKGKNIIIRCGKEGE